MKKLRVLDLFSGIGGFSLGLERTGGFETVAFCEIDIKAQRVLKRQWPNVPVFRDIQDLFNAELRKRVGAVDVICGGFPCQDISLANNRGAGLAGEKSGLWREYARLIGEIRPRFVVVENVPVLRSRGLGDVLRDLAELGYDAEWECIPAAAIGAPHIRDRLWLVAYPNRDGEPNVAVDGEARGYSSPVVNAGRGRHRAPQAQVFTGWDATQFAGWWSPEPRLDRVVDGVPGQVDRLKQLGNAVVPQIPELIGRAILASLDHADASDRRAA